MKIAIIGGGAAGLTAAWFLEQDHEIHLFEAQEQLGGHAQTAYITFNGQTIPIEVGFEFFSACFPALNRLLSLLNVPVHAYPLSYAFYTPAYTMALPPLIQGKISLHGIKPRSLIRLLQFKYLLFKGKSFVKKDDTTVSLSSFAHSLFFTDSFRNDFLFPFFAGAWGTSLDEMKNFSAYNVLTWAITNCAAGLTSSTWFEVEGGISRYITALTNELTHTRIHRSTRVTALTYKNPGYVVTTHTGSTFEVDHIIFATNAREAKKLIEKLPHANPQALALSRIRYFNTTIAIHADERYMPPAQCSWQIANIYYDGQVSSLTICKPWRGAPIFRSWIMPGHPLPEKLFLVKEFEHANVDSNYFLAQQEIGTLQGVDNLWFVGIYVQGIDSHNSAIQSSVNVAQQLAPHSARLAHFLRKS